MIIPQKCSFDIKWLFSLIGVMKTRKVDLIHAHEFAMNTYGSIASAVTKVPIITTVHGKNYYHDKWRRRVAYRFVSKQSTMVAVSADIKRFLIEKVGINHERIVTIRNGIDTKLYRTDDAVRRSVREELGIDEEQPVIGAVGNLYPVKGHTYLLKAMAIVKEKYPHAMLVIAGRGEILDQLREEARGLGIKQKVVFLGFSEKIPAFLQSLDIFVLPSLSEGLPLSVLEAIAAGKPVIATNVGGISEVLDDGYAELLVPPRNPDALAEKILLLLRNPELASRLRGLGRMKVEKEFSLNSMMEKYQELYRNC